MSKDKTYLALKNIIHNDLGISRNEILTIVEDIVHEAVERQVQIAIKTAKYSIKDHFNNALDKEVRRLLHNSEYYTTKNLMEKIAELVLSKVEVSVNVKQ